MSEPKSARVFSKAGGITILVLLVLFFTVWILKETVGKETRRQADEVDAMRERFDREAEERQRAIDRRRAENEALEREIERVRASNR